MRCQRFPYPAFFILASLVAAGYCTSAWSEFLPPEGSVVGIIVIANVGVRAEILEGTKTETLKRAVGHVSGTARPGQKGNVCLAAHRVTFFRPLRNIAPGDEVELRFPGGTARYRVETTEIVDSHEVRVLDPTSDDQLTLITCYPFMFAGTATRRFIVHAKAL